MLQGFYNLDGIRTLYVSELLMINPNQIVNKEYFADLDLFEFVFTIGGDAEEDTAVSVWGKNEIGQLVTAHRLIYSELEEVMVIL
ncbi:hypothetical protein [Bacillus sp. SJS]|uniref:hypothetical protein n=1 Tax=Bacillus sp. SJS TaxID=1423321 RepID=UPI0006924B00|nr:hypothetical protein [Bacillus sp. SJS]KZZ84945.1 hypothetical protein AS29_007780 [Bacillus sp. SJS]